METYSLDQHTDALADYLPSGPLFAAKRIQDSNFRKLLAGFAGELFTAQGYLKTFDDEYNPQTTNMFLSEWERALGIPDACFTGTGTNDSRRTDILTKLAALGIQTIADYESLGTIYGKTVTVEPLDTMASPPVPIVYPDARFTLVITGVNLVVGLPPYSVPFTPGADQSTLQCLYNDLKPSTCQILFENS